jgi:predicted oxidoreductase
MGLVDADVIVVGAGLAGLAATAELASAGRRVLLLDQEPESNLGGQAFWSFGGLFLVDFELHAPAVIVTSGGIGANFDLIRQNWPARLGPAPERMISGVPEHVDGRMLAIAERAGGRLANRDRMWHYTEGIENWDPIWARHGIRILPGPSSMWFDARGQRFPRRTSPASTPWARWALSGRAATTTRGSS